jgi:hypothetical protein
VTHYVDTGISPNAQGGFMYVNGAPYVNITSCSFTSSQGQSGGTLYCTNVVQVNMLSCQFTENCALNGPGGAVFFGINTGIYIDGFSILFFSICFFSEYRLCLYELQLHGRAGGCDRH